MLYEYTFHNKTLIFKVKGWIYGPQAARSWLFIIFQHHFPAQSLALQMQWEIIQRWSLYHVWENHSMTRDIFRKYIPESLLWVQKGQDPPRPLSWSLGGFSLDSANRGTGVQEGWAPVPGQVGLGKRGADLRRQREAVNGLFLSCSAMLSVKPLKQKQHQGHRNSRPAARKNMVAGPWYTKALIYEAKLELAGRG